MEHGSIYNSLKINAGGVFIVDFGKIKMWWHVLGLVTGFCHSIAFLQQCIFIRLFLEDNICSCSLFEFIVFPLVLYFLESYCFVILGRISKEERNSFFPSKNSAYCIFEFTKCKCLYNCGNSIGHGVPKHWKYRVQNWVYTTLEEMTLQYQGGGNILITNHGDIESS